MDEHAIEQDVASEELDEILEETTLSFEENLIVANSENCDRYGCTCIAYEKCCGCLLQ